MPRSWTSTPRSVAPRTSSVSTCRFPPDSRANSSRAAVETGWSRRAVQQGAELVGPERAEVESGQMTVALEARQAR